MIAAMISRRPITTLRIRTAMARPSASSPYTMTLTTAKVFQAARQKCPIRDQGGVVGQSDEDRLPAKRRFMEAEPGDVHGRHGQERDQQQQGRHQQAGHRHRGGSASAAATRRLARRAGPRGGRSGGRSAPSCAAARTLRDVAPAPGLLHRAPRSSLGRLCLGRPSPGRPLADGRRSRPPIEQL